MKYKDTKCKLPKGRLLTIYGDLIAFRYGTFRINQYKLPHR